MKPSDIQKAFDYDLFVTRDKRVHELLALVVQWADDHSANESVKLAIEELKSIASRAW